MIFLNILLLILKILAIIIVGILVILSIILFAGVKYDIKADYEDKPYYYIKISYLFGIFKYVMEIDKDSEFKIFGKVRKKKEKPLAETEVKVTEVEEKNEKLKEDIKINKSKKKKVKAKPKKKSFIEKVKEKYTKFKNIYNHPDRKIITKHIIILIKRLFKALKPKKFVLRGVFGFDDPAMTGYVLGIVSIIKAFVPFIIDVDGDFQNEILKLELEGKGKTNLFSLLLPIILFITKKPIWKLIRKDEENV